MTERLIQGELTLVGMSVGTNKNTTPQNCPESYVSVLGKESDKLDAVWYTVLIQT